MSTLAKPFPPPAPSAEAASRLEADSYAEIVTLAWRSMRRLGIAPDALPDAVQDVLCVVHRRRADFRGEASLRTWVFGIVVRVASNLRRGQRRLGNVLQPVEPHVVESAASAEPSPFERLEQGEAVRILHRLLDELPEEQRDVLVLADLEELPLPEVAQALGLRESTCKSRLRTARRLFNAAVARERARHTRRDP